MNGSLIWDYDCPSVTSCPDCSEVITLVYLLLLLCFVLLFFYWREKKKNKQEKNL